ncbi:MAG TPA: HAMP domain-containing protein, partial [Thermoanaerobaculia bacterium]|nr:HAMP domain-containing protein [Thermoanaerobaculia bacterium]
MPPPPKKRRVPITFLVWLTGVVSIVALGYIDGFFSRLRINIPFIGFVQFLAWLVTIGLTLYGFAVISRWILQRLFWTVGRRLFLSYVMIGVLPFFLFAILLAAILYLVAGVGTQANFRAERQASLGQLESLNEEYALQKRTPREEKVEIYDSANGSDANLPEWLATNFSGTVLRDGKPLHVVARQYPSEDGARTVVFVQPLDHAWEQEIEEHGGMIVSQQIGSREGEGFQINEGDKMFERFGQRAIGFNRILFFDITEANGLTEWESGKPAPSKRLFTIISNPTRNLLQFYFGGATNSDIMRGIFGGIAALFVLLMFAYLIASAFAAVLIFSISRAVNRIEKGTKAVERGDFSYRIRMKPQNQLGEMAQSFDHMTESIASLLSTVAEKERLQSEIEIAATIQRNLLPKEGPQFRGVSFSAHFEPTTAIGGDYYDVFNLDKTRLAVAIGDVSGHGLS